MSGTQPSAPKAPPLESVHERRRRQQLRDYNATKAKIAADPDYAAKYKAMVSRKNKKYAERECATPEGLQRRRDRRDAAKKRRKARLSQSPEGLAQLRTERRERDRRREQNNIEKTRARWRAKDKRKRNRAKAAARLSQADALRALRSLIPAWLPRHSRDDVLGELTLEMLEGRCTADKVRATIKRAVTKHNAPLWQELSLDAPVPGMDGVTFLDVLAERDS